MSLFAIGDLHLSFGTDKPMDIFRGWEKHYLTLEKNWLENINDNDTTVLAGDISWGMNFSQSLKDFQFIHSLPGKKIILKGNHDYWWNSMNKMRNFLAENGFDDISILHNNHYRYENIGICGTRGWVQMADEPADAKILAREVQRLETSLASAAAENLMPVVFLHYPPVYGSNCNYEIIESMRKYGVKKCYYGHVHGYAQKNAITGERDGIDFRMISGDYIQFSPEKVM
ncbi:MAG TPA: serine/threonine protein phosphatase [Ruminococcus sp.]|nr:serine/threonine protein phosphatase [Ruminococcus sp.]HCR73869.1 serine/threonine protein phosphatase [Ruminococcus sp.]